MSSSEPYSPPRRPLVLVTTIQLPRRQSRTHPIYTPKNNLKGGGIGVGRKSSTSFTRFIPIQPARRLNPETKQLQSPRNRLPRANLKRSDSPTAAQETGRYVSYPALENERFLEPWPESPRLWPLGLLHSGLRASCAVPLFPYPSNFQDDSGSTAGAFFIET